MELLFFIGLAFLIAARHEIWSFLTRGPRNARARLQREREQRAFAKKMQERAIEQRAREAREARERAEQLEEIKRALRDL